MLSYILRSGLFCSSSVGSGPVSSCERDAVVSGGSLDVEGGEAASKRASVQAGVGRSAWKRV